MAHQDENDTAVAGDLAVFHKEEPQGRTPPEEICLAQISGYLETHLGPVDLVLHEIVPDTVHVDVLCVAPSERFPFVRLVTSGMSDLPMAVPAGSGAPAYAELMITLPGNWRLAQADLEDERWYWPIRLIKMLARLPHKYHTWLGWGHSIPNGEPPEPYAPDTDLCGAIILPPVTTPESFGLLRIDENKSIAFHAVVPMHEAEMNLKLDTGTDALLDLFEQCGINDIVDMQRIDVTRHAQ